MASGSGKDAISESLNTKASASSSTSNATDAPTQVITRAVVVEVLYDLSAFPEDDITELKALVKSPDLVSSAPRNSIIARPISNGADKQAPEAREEPTDEEKQKSKKDKEPVPEKEKIGEQGILAYPFFPPHLCMPLKPGEQVWLISDSPDTEQEIMYWMCRISEPDHVDDVNYTHGDRKLVGDLAPKKSKDKADEAEKAAASSEQSDSPAPSQGTPSGGEGQSVRSQEVTQNATGQAENEKEVLDKNGDGIDDRLFGFPNGTGEEDGYTLKEEFAYEDLVGIATGYRQFRPQDVPRYTKRPGDFVIQGSNNTLICLGEERGWKKDDDPASSELSNATETEGVRDSRVDKSWGTIDIVAGRGRYNWRFLGKDPSDDPFSPAARTIMNSPDPEKGRHPYVEVNKSPKESNKSENNSYDNPAEGDPDYFGDAARIIVAHSSEIDTNFSINESGASLPTPIGEEFGSYEIKNKSGNNPSYVLSKADEVRLIARKVAADEPMPGAPEINGSIRIIKEGDPSEDLAAILMLPDGTIQVSGSKIVIGRTPDDGGGGGPTEGPGPSMSQPYVRYSDLEKLWHDTMDALTAFCDGLLQHRTPGYGAPSPEINAHTNILKGKIPGLKSQIEEVKSERIFGE